MARQPIVVVAKTLAIVGFGLLFFIWLIREQKQIRLSFLHGVREKPSGKFSTVHVKGKANLGNASLWSQTLPPPILPPKPVNNLLQRLNATQILKHFENSPLSYEQIPDYFPQPSLVENDMMAIYSKTAWMKLRDIVTTRHVTMLVSGGSSMTGAGGIIAADRCDSLLATMFPNITLVNRAHGSRNSFHTMQMMHSYYPKHVDVILWEFSINDVAYNVVRKEAAYLEHRNQLILYLEQVERVAKQRKQEPPLVILLYLWTTPFTIWSGRIDQHDFDSHGHLAEHYDFVVGHVNAANYFMSWQLGEAETKAVALVDHHHPNVRGHLILAYLLKDLITNEQRPETPKEINQTRPTLKWACGDELPEKLKVRNLLTNRHPVASFTGELPKNDLQLAGMLHPILPKNATYETRGKIDPLRVDRQKSIMLPCCRVGNLSFDLSPYNPLQGFQINLTPTRKQASVFLDDEDATRLLFNAQRWDCLLRISGGRSSFLADWLVMEKERQVSTISFCNKDPKCGTSSAPRKSFGLMSLAVYGGKRDDMLLTT